MFRKKASGLPLSIYNELKDTLEESYIGPAGKAFNRNSLQKLLDMERPKSWENLSSTQQENNFDAVYKYLYDVVYPKTRGQYQKEYIKEKYDSGQVGKY